MTAKKVSRGEQFRQDVLAEFDGLRPDERIILDEVCRTIDVLDDPLLSIVEQRLHRMVLSRLIGQLGLTDGPDEPPSMSGPSVRGRRAAKIRWDREKERSQS
jgi:hypothetical protein